MPIEKVILDNFKTHVRTEIPLSPLTVLVGPNSVGKTSVLEAIQFIAHLGESLDPIGSARFIRRGTGGCAVKLTFAAQGDSYVSFSMTPSPSAPTWECAWKANGKGGSLSADLDQLMAIKDRLAFNELRSVLSRLVGTATQLRLDPDRLSAPSTLVVAAQSTTLAQDGSGLAGVLGILRLFDEARFVTIEQDLRRVVPSLERIRIVKVPFYQKERRYLDESGDLMTEEMVQLEGAEIHFDFVGAPDVSAREASEGTIIALGVLTAAHGGNTPRTVLLDDIERALHPRAQRQLVENLRALVNKTPGLQIIATSHSPYLVDAFHPEEVIVLGLRKDGTAAARQLSEHPDAKRAMEVLSTGEFLAAEQEDWVVEAAQ